MRRTPAQAFARKLAAKLARLAKSNMRAQEDDLRLSNLRAAAATAWDAVLSRDDMSAFDYSARCSAFLRASRACSAFEHARRRAQAARDAVAAALINAQRDVARLAAERDDSASTAVRKPRRQLKRKLMSAPAPAPTPTPAPAARVLPPHLIELQSGVLAYVGHSTLAAGLRGLMLHCCSKLLARSASAPPPPAPAASASACACVPRCSLTLRSNTLLGYFGGQQINKADFEKRRYAQAKSLLAFKGPDGMLYVDGDVAVGPRTFTWINSSLGNDGRKKAGVHPTVRFLADEHGIGVWLLAGTHLHGTELQFEQYTWGATLKPKTK